MKARLVPLIVAVTIAVVGLFLVALGASAAARGSAGLSLPAGLTLVAGSPKAASTLAASPATLAAAAVAGRGIQVVGIGIVQAKPDMAWLTVGVENRAPTAQEAQNQNNQQVSGVLAAIKAKGIDDKDIQTTGLSLHPVFDQDQKVTGYVATNSLRIKVGSIAAVGELFDAAVAAGANQAGGVEFGLSNEGALRQQALGDATKDARAKADVLAKAIGVSIVGIEAVIEEASSGPIVPMSSADSVKAASTVPIEPGQLSVQAQVRVVYSYQ